ncbi:zinc-dependent metalloprotease [Lewinella sp. 4G2]|uniref:zinc-dependent metalloprotease n=1 Tax=Lewinella sp. 4G2 TaxID=1803372 RepID=UPI0018D2A6BF|nr:zinc-dependent metalloprotease [Lewinella sp. 4G2]
MKNYLLLLALLVASWGLSAQMSSLQEVKTPTGIFSTSSQKSVASQAVAKELASFAGMETDPETYAQLVDSAPEDWTLDIPANGVTPAGLQLKLRRNNIIRDGARVRLASTGAFATDIHLGYHYIGEVVGQPDSRVAFSLLDNEMMGTIDMADGKRLSIGKVENITKSAGQPDAYIIFPDDQLAERQELDCATDDNGGTYSDQDLAYVTEKSTSVGCVDMYMEVDYDIVQNKGGVSAGSQYVTAIFNQVAILYDDINVDLYISEMFAWDSPSPYGGASSLDYLRGFQAYRNSFNGDLAHLVAYGASGGVAVLNGLCHFNPDNKMSFASVHSNYANVPTYSWSVMVMAHEIGHQLGSQHTHACVWNGNGTAIDGCAGGTEGSCPNPGYPQGGGTIMSYCHLRPGIGINFNRGFGPQPSSVIQGRVSASQGCLNNDCDNRGGDGNGGGGDGDGGNGGGDGSGGGDGGDPNCPGGRNVEFRLTLDDFGMETTWAIRTENGLVVTTGGPYEKKAKGQTIVRRNICLPDGCYLLEVMDDHGDGICCEYGNGSYQLTSSDGTLLAGGDGTFEFSSIRDFCVDGAGGNGGDGDGDGDDNDVDCPAFDFNVYPPISYGTNQDDGTVEVQDSGSTIYLENNAWKAIDYDYNITANTWVSFYFKSTKQGEVHGFGFDNNQVISSSYSFRLYGTQAWGISNFNNYDGSGEWAYYEVPVGQFYTGLTNYIFFIADQDIGSQDGNSYFRSFTLTEGQPCNNARSLQENGGLPEFEGTGLQLAPNPADTEIRVTVPGASETVNYQVLDINGRELLKGNINPGGERVSVSSLPSGAYLLRTGDGQVKRFTVTR